MFNRAEMLNRRAAAPGFMASEVMKKLEIEKSSTIADIGSGGGFFTMKFAATTGLDGTVYAVDTNAKNLEYIRKQAEDGGLNNVKAILVEGDFVGIHELSCDLCFLRNVYHHFTDPEEYFMNLKRFIKSGGRVAIIDYRKTNSLSFVNLTHHYVDEDKLINTLKKCGYKHIASYDFIEQQSFNIFELA